jgi:hypothetical protein
VTARTVNFFRCKRSIHQPVLAFPHSHTPYPQFLPSYAQLACPSCVRVAREPQQIVDTLVFHKGICLYPQIIPHYGMLKIVRARKDFKVNDLRAWHHPVKIPQPSHLGENLFSDCGVLFSLRNDLEIKNDNE